MTRIASCLCIVILLSGCAKTLPVSPAAIDPTAPARGALGLAVTVEDFFEDPEQDAQEDSVLESTRWVLSLFSDLFLSVPAMMLEYPAAAINLVFVAPAWLAWDTLMDNPPMIYEERATRSYFAISPSMNLARLGLIESTKLDTCPKPCPSRTKELGDRLLAEAIQEIRDEAANPEKYAEARARARKSRAAPCRGVFGIGPVTSC